MSDILTLRASRHVTPGDLIVTREGQRARLNLGAVGRTEIAPSSRVRVMRASESGYQLALEEGEIHARIWAPPRFFTVETPAGMAIDLGCVYTLRATADGRALLKVTAGEVELHHSGGIVVVPGGNEATIGKAKSMALPTPITADAELRRAVHDFEVDSRNRSKLDTLVAMTDTRSTIVLWHLLTRVDRDEREVVYDRLSTLVKAAHPSREATMSLDRHALDVWRSILEPGWSTERPGWVKRQLKTFWRSIN